jgi:hypothetical protein
MMVRAKFKCSGKTDDGQVELQPVTSGSAENEQFYKWTPGGQIRLSTVNEAALAEFEVGKEYYVDFTLAEAGEKSAGTP